MDKLFLQIINMTITSSYIILFIILIRFFLKKAPKIFSYLLWLIPFLRLIFPFSFESVFSLITINKETIPESIVYSQTPQIQSGIMVIDRTVNRVLPAAQPTASVNPMQIWISIGTGIWLIGIGVLLIYSVYSTIKLSKKLKVARLVKGNIYRKDDIDTAFVFGLFRPKIYLPYNLSIKEESYIIKHEETHIKRFDHIVKFLTFIIVSIHWFNPLVWIGFYLMSEDMELSCDESVIKEMGYEIKKDYSNSLLSLSTGRRIIGGSPIAFGENNTKGRIKNILNYRKPKFWVSLVVLAIVIALGIGFLSDRPGLAKEPRDSEAEAYVNEKYGFSFKFPDSWEENRDKIKIQEEEDGSSVEFLYIFEKDGKEELQWMFTISVMSEEEYEEKLYDDMPMMGVYLAEKDGNVYLLYESIENGILDQDEIERYHETVHLSYREIIEAIHIDNPDKSQSDLKEGLYVTDDDISYLQIEEGNGFAFQRHIATSYIPRGHYIIYGDRLFLYEELGGEESIIEFKINGDSLIFESGEIAEGIVEKGTEFIYRGSDFLEESDMDSVGDHIGYITMMDFHEDILHLDPVELLGLEDEERAKELGIDVNSDMPGGYYVYDPETGPIELTLTNETRYKLLDWSGDLNHDDVTKEDFIEYNNSLDYSPLYNIFMEDGYVIMITEQYLP